MREGLRPQQIAFSNEIKPSADEHISLMDAYEVNMTDRPMSLLARLYIYPLAFSEDNRFECHSFSELKAWEVSEKLVGFRCGVWIGARFGIGTAQPPC